MANAQFGRQEIQAALTTLAPILAGWPFDNAGRNGQADDAMKLAASLHGAQGNLIEARRLAENILSPSLKFETLLELPAYHARHGDVEGARAQLKALLPGGGGHPTPEVIAIPGVVAAQLAAGDLQGALATMTMFVPSQEAQITVIGILIAQGKVTEAGQIFAALPPQSLALRYQVAVAQARSGDPSAARRYAPAETNPRDRDVLVSAIAFAQAKRGETSVARETAASIVDADIRSRTAFDIALTEAGTGDATALLAAASAARPEDRVSQLLRAVQRLVEENRMPHAR